MGELSKKIGEQGEKIVKNFLEIIGWENSSHSITLPCSFDQKHKSEGTKKRVTHGLDGLFVYETPLFDNILEHIVISVKFSDKQYLKNENAKFKAHFKDLAHTVECYEKSSLQNEYSEGFNAKSNKTRGLLFWIHNKEQSESIVDKITSRIDDDLQFNTIYIVDNNRMSFIQNSILFIKNNTKYNNHLFNFHYIDTGNNPSTLNKQYDGDILPIQMLFSDIQLFKLEEKNTEQVTFVMVMKDNFEEDNLKRLIGLAHNLSKNFTSIVIYFPNYDSLHNENIVAKIKNQFKNNNFTKKIKVYSFENRFQNLGD